MEKEEVFTLLEERKFTALKPLLLEMNAVDLAEIFNETEEDKDLLILFRLLSKDLAAETFVEMDSDAQEKLIGKLTVGAIQHVVMLFIIAWEVNNFEGSEVLQLLI